MTLACLFGVVVDFTINYHVTLRVPPLLGKKGIGRALVVKRDTITFEYHGKRIKPPCSIDTRGGAKQQQTKKGKK